MSEFENKNKPFSPLQTMQVCLAAADMSVSQQYCLTANIGFGLNSISCSGDRLR